ncbi:MAG: hypothetical protein GSR84_02435, partial [Desulfurococcales archaeon]|nr:hypothetical protein [Desulfurococcales archaeon]
PTLPGPPQDTAGGGEPSGAPPEVGQAGENATQASPSATGGREPRVIAAITASIISPGGQATGPQGAGEDAVVTSRPSLDIDIGFLRSVKPLLLEHEVEGRVVDLQLVDINGYCVKCGLLITVDTGKGTEYVLALGYWSTGERVVGVVNLMLYIKPGDLVVVEALRDSYVYHGSRLYIAYEIKVPGTGVELERVAPHEHHVWGSHE